MSSNHGGASRRPEPAGHLRRPSFDRPSLFAGMDDDVVDVEPDRVRILSSLEPRKRAAAPRKGQRQRKAARARWWSRALIGLMAMGLVTVGLSVYLLLRSAHDTEQALSSWPLPTSAASTQTPGEGEWLIDPPAAGPLDAAVAQAEAAALMSLSAPAEPARIETVAPDVMATTTATATAPETPATAATPAAVNPLAALATPAEAATRPEATPAPQTPAAAPTRAAVTAATAAAPAKAAAPPPPAAKSASANPVTTTTAAAPPTARAASRSDADVSLLEAVFPNHDPVKATRADLFRACQGMNGPEAAICRARICVQHPGVPACQ